MAIFNSFLLNYQRVLTADFITADEFFIPVVSPPVLKSLPSVPSVPPYLARKNAIHLPFGDGLNIWYPSKIVMAWGLFMVVYQVYHITTIAIHGHVMFQ